jgi:hypothetical protein
MQNFQSSLEGGCLSVFMGLSRCARDTVGNDATIAHRPEVHANSSEISYK